MKRYCRQTILPNFGMTAQVKLLNSKVLVVGAGGLGSPVLQYLAAAGVGNIGIVDGDVVELSNLQRQVLYNEHDIGQPKAQLAKQKLASFNAQTQVDAYDVFIDPHNVFDLVQPYDLIVDATDNFPTRYLLNDVGFLLKKPLVFASIFRYEAQLSVFHYGEHPFNLRDVFSDIPDENLIPNCQEAGVLGSLVGMVGCLQANEVIKIITNIGKVTSGNLLLYNSLDNRTLQLALTKNKTAFLPHSKEEILAKSYGEMCATRDNHTIAHWETLKTLLHSPKSALIDVREKHELPKITQVQVLEIPLNQLSEQSHFLQHLNHIIFVCASGKRSKQAIDIMQTLSENSKLYHLKGGLHFFENHLL